MDPTIWIFNEYIFKNENSRLGNLRFHRLGSLRPQQQQQRRENTILDHPNV